MLKTFNFCNNFKPLFNNLRTEKRFIGTKIMSKKRALILLASGAEEMEFVTAADILVRGGVDVVVAGVGGKELVKCSRGVKIQPEISISEACRCLNFDAVILPGGLEGSRALAQSAEVGKLLKEFECGKKIIAAICAAPTALQAHKIGFGSAITSYPSVKNDLIKDYNYKECNVVVDCNIITSRGPATAIEFALALVEMLVSAEKACQISKDLLYTT
ncbi:unnamed protein product [Phyllotreta striolata]|uniref:DJ-1/PfpI domain-containing protein n=1 Tax=Phyllotreta striolata TaxID=444603 RepID=A0A9N9XI46_PHYSR|nr:unnamed protein product [Phyllotreta striolata]